MKRESFSICGQRKSGEGAATDLTSKIFRPKVIRSIEETIDKNLSKYKTWFTWILQSLPEKNIHPTSFLVEFWIQIFLSQKVENISNL